MEIVLSIIGAIGSGALFLVASNLAKLLADVNLLRKQLNSQAFIAFTAKFDSTVLSFPAGAWRNRHEAIEYEGEDLKQIQNSSFAFFHLCSQEFYMYRKGLVDANVWSIWEKDLKLNISSHLLRAQWESLKKEFEPYSEFYRYVNDQHDSCN